MYFHDLAFHCKRRRNRILSHLCDVPDILSILTESNDISELQDLGDETDCPVGEKGRKQ